MAEESFKISLIGEGGQFVKTLQQAEDELKDFEKAVKNATNVDAFKAATEGAKRTQAAIANLHKATGDLAKGNQRATSTLTDLSRIAQDAPYGFIGIANNINPLLESFQRLQAESGGTKAALTGIVGAMTGPAGIGLAVGVVSSLLVKFGGDLFSAGDDADHLEGALVKVNTALEATQAYLQSIKGDLDFGNRLAAEFGKVAGLKDSLMLQGDNVAIAEAIQKAEEERQRLSKAYADALFKSTIALSKEEKEAHQKLLGETEKALQEASKLEQDLLQQRRITTLQIQSAKNKEAEDANKAAEDLQKKHNAAAEKENKKRLKAEEDFRKAMDGLRKQARFQADVDFDPSYKPFVDGHKMFIDSMGQLAEKRDGPAIPGLPTAEDQLEWNKQMKAARAQTLAEQAAFQAQMAGLMESFVENSLINVGETLGNIISGSIEDPLEGFRNLIGDLLKDMGKMLIQHAIKVKVFQKALAFATANPGLAIAAGIGLIAAGTIVKSSSKPRRFAEGGIVSGPTYGLMGEYAGARNNPEVIAPLDKLEGMLSNKGGGEVIVINERRRGKDMLLQASRASRSKNTTS